MRILRSAMILALFALFVLSAYNTVRGFGQDVSKVGDEMEEAADEKQKY